MAKFLGTELPMPPGLVTGSCGMKQSGKSLYSYEQGYQIVKEEGGEVLYLDTEEPTDFMFTVEVTEPEPHKPWKEVFEKKYETEVPFNFEYLPNVESTMDYIGIHGKVIITEGEEKVKRDGTVEEKGIKLEFKLIKVDTVNSPFAKTLKEKDIRYIVIDSVTVFNSLTTGGRQNFAIRSQAEEMFFSTIQQLVYKRMKETGKPIYIFTTNHLANNPTDPFTARMDEKFLVEKGGKTVGHYTKVLFGFKKMLTPHGAREMVVMRYPNIPEFGLSYPLLITDDGFQNTNAKELKSVKAEQKEARQEAKAS